MVKIEIETGNDWFWRFDDGTYMPEMVAEVIRDAAKRIERGERNGSILDGNGNRVGLFSTVDAFTPAVPVCDECGATMPDGFGVGPEHGDGCSLNSENIVPTWTPTGDLP